MGKSRITGATIPYQLRPHKAIERNLFVSILRKLDRCSLIDVNTYRYVGFGAAFLEDFKVLHTEFGISDMDCIEYDFFAYTRQDFNNPFEFIKLHNISSTKYITGVEFKNNKNQIIWLDYASPKEFRQQLLDIELLTEKITDLDILKFTFNSHINSFCQSLNIQGKIPNFNRILEILKEDATYNIYLPDKIDAKDLMDNFSGVIRAMANRAVKRGLVKGNKSLEFNHIASFSYADGQSMTTITGIVTKKEQIEMVLDQSGLNQWEFYQRENKNSELIAANEITVPAMTVSERIIIDKQIKTLDAFRLAKSLNFLYGTSEEEHVELINGYHKYYKYLPYYSKVTY